MSEKRYYWLKLKEDFFQSKRIKKMRKLAGGDTLTIIYFKMQLVAMKNDGLLKYSGVEPTMAEEIALEIDEEVDNVRLALSYLLSCGLAEEYGDGDCFLPYAVENVGSEGTSAKRVREYRERQKALHCNDEVTNVKQIGNVDIDIEKEIDIDIDNSVVVVDDEKRLLQPINDIQPDWIQRIIDAWNGRSCTQNIRSIEFGGRRYNNTRLCAKNDVEGFIGVIGDLDNQEYFMKMANERLPLKYDWFCDPNNFIKVVEGNYRYVKRSAGQTGVDHDAELDEFFN